MTKVLNKIVDVVAVGCLVVDSTAFLVGVPAIIWMMMNSVAQMGVK